MQKDWDNTVLHLHIFQFFYFFYMAAFWMHSMYADSWPPLQVMQHILATSSHQEISQFIKLQHREIQNI